MQAGLGGCMSLIGVSLVASREEEETTRSGWLESTPGTIIRQAGVGVVHQRWLPSCLDSLAIICCLIVMMTMMVLFGAAGNTPNETKSKKKNGTSHHRGKKRGRTVLFGLLLCARVGCDSCIAWVTRVE